MADFQIGLCPHTLQIPPCDKRGNKRVAGKYYLPYLMSLTCEKPEV